ncbi:TonB-dependent receptor [Sphingomonas deserti]|uniref:TonB-dependent receptor n=2 Tax=Allosphingosinicella deserti TaxID=2116704 RepID=A0A2P7QKT1_9SPHN|nr:TonB-dependent receptor [Sphingomonas deserti]
MKLHVFVSTIAIISAPAFGADIDAAAEAAADGIVVTALRAPVAAERVAASVTVLTREEIDRTQAPIVSDILVRTPGISIVRNGGYGTSTSIRIRGADSDQSVLVVDGVKLADASSTGGGYNWANLLTGDIDRVEILRGPQSILWGSNAIGGVINVTTAAPERPLEATIDVSGGSRETAQARAAVGGRTGPLDWRIAGRTFTTAGISAISPRYGGNESDPYRNSGGTGRLGLRVSDAVSLDLRGSYGRSRVGIDSAGTVPDSPERSESEEWTGYGAANIALLDGRLANRIAFSQAEIARTNVNPTRLVRPTSFDAKGRSRRYEYQGSLTLSEQIGAVFGAEREEQNMRSASPPNSNAAYKTIRAEARIDSLYAQVNAELLRGLTVTGGVRHDDHDRFGGSTVFGIGGAWSIGDRGTRIRANYGEGFKAPTLYQLYSEYGNDALQPEKARGWEAGIEQRLLGELVTLSATWFDRTTRNLIVYSGCPTANRPPLCFTPGTTTPRAGYYANVQKSAAEGVELSGALRLGGFRADANYSWIAAEDRSGGLNDGNQLARQPRHLANGSIAYGWRPGAEASLAVRHAGGTWDTARTSATVTPFRNDAYTIVDARIELPASARVSVYARVENLFDDHYETARRYGALGRSAYAGIRARF